MGLFILLFGGLLVGCGDKDTGGEDPVDADSDGYAADVDCDDDDADIHPDAAEVCDNVDNDCNGLLDDADPGLQGAPSWNLDVDGDGYGDPDATVTACLQPSDAVDDDQDCDDGNAAIKPGADELCDGVDNDCDGFADDLDPEGAVDGSTFYTDADGDGYGDSAAPVQACELPEGASADDTDCDDAEATVNPGHPELCDGLDNDCDPATGESGTASWTDSDGEIRDITGSLTGSAEAPASLALAEAGTLRLCAGTWYAGLTVQADVQVLGLPADPASVVLDAGGASSVVDIRGEGLEVGIEGLALTGGVGSAGPFASSEGGGLLCQAGAAPTSLRLSGVDVYGNHANFGGGLLTSGCDTELVQTRIFQNTAVAIGAGGWLIDGAHTWKESSVVENIADDSAGGVIFVKDAEDVEVDFDRVEVRDNQAVSGTVGGVGVVGGSLIWTGSSKVDSGLLGNRAEDWPGGLYLSEATVTADVVDFGELDSDRDNHDIDVYIEELGASYYAPDDASFECGTDGCGEAESFDLSDTGSTWSAEDGQLIANVVRSDSRKTIERFQVHGYGDLGCSATPVLLMADSSSLDTARWDELWVGEDVLWASEADWNDLGYPRHAVQEGDGIALGYICNCPSAELRCYGTRASSVPVTATDAGFGTGYGILSETDFTAGSTAYYFSFFGPLIYTRVEVVEL